jgi:hypothetical protein
VEVLIKESEKREEETLTVTWLASKEADGVSKQVDQALSSGSRNSGDTGRSKYLVFFLFFVLRREGRGEPRVQIQEMLLDGRKV